MEEYVVNNVAEVMMNNLMETMDDVAEFVLEVVATIADAASWTFKSSVYCIFIGVEFSDCLNLLQNVWLCFTNRLDLFLSSVDNFLWYGFLNLMRLNSISFAGFLFNFILNS